MASIRTAARRVASPIAVAIVAATLAFAGPGAPASAACVWSFQDPPVQSGLSVSLDKISALSASDVWAVGERGDGRDPDPPLGRDLVDRDGSPDAGCRRGAGRRLGCEPDGRVGGWIRRPGSRWSEFHAMTLHYDGSTWTQIANPAGSVAGSTLLGVDAIAGKAVAVGEVGTGTTYRTLAMSWTGTVWRMQAAPRPDDHSVLSAVSRVSWNNAWAVGQQGLDSTTLIEHWDGTQWTVEPSANPGDSARLDAITRVPGSADSGRSAAGIPDRTTTARSSCGGTGRAGNKCRLHPRSGHRCSSTAWRRSRRNRSGPSASRVTR